ncbi:hypothetical protein KR018_009854 [Drosophila ironensis]|nr:hypothetical protein KR018_009854 [Drosophila ironensis]
MDVEIRQQFDEMGVEPSGTVLERCVELAITYSVHDATEFVEQWMAFSLSHLHGDEPTTENLGEFERKVLQLRKDRPHAKASAPKAKAYASADSYALIEDDPMMEEYMGDSVADSAALHTPKAKKEANRPAGLKGGVLFSPASYTPKSAKKIPDAGTPGNTVKGKPGDVVDTFGHPKLLAGSNWQSQVEHALPVVQKLLHKNAPLTAANLRYMKDLLNDRCDDLHDRIVDTGRALIERKLGAEGAAECSWYPQDKNTLEALHMLHAVGMVHSEDDGPLDAYSAILSVADAENSSLLSLNFSKIKSASIFPGQVVLAKGFIPKGNSFVVEEMHTERKLTPPNPLKVDRELQFVVAAGPFTDSADLSYEPLHDLMMYLKDHRPDVLIMVGPFLDADHKAIGDLSETFESFFEKMVAGIMEVVGSHTTVIMVSSQKDAMAHPVYPTPPPTLRRSYPNLHMVADPSVVDLDGITVGVTSTDVIDHLLSHEFAANAGERMHRSINHLFHQGSFYPVYPPADENMAYDAQLALKYAQLRQQPNVLILPGDQRHFIRLVSDCLVINPGRLADTKGGTFARFLVAPTVPGKAANMFNSVACQVQRI